MIWVSVKNLETTCIVTDAIQIKLNWIGLNYTLDRSLRWEAHGRKNDQLTLFLCVKLLCFVRQINTPESFQVQHCWNWLLQLCFLWRSGRRVWEESMKPLIPFSGWVTINAYRDTYLIMGIMWNPKKAGLWNEKNGLLKSWEPKPVMQCGSKPAGDALWYKVLQQTEQEQTPQCNYLPLVHTWEAFSCSYCIPKKVQNFIPCLESEPHWEGYLMSAYE